MRGRAFSLLACAHSLLSPPAQLWYDLSLPDNPSFSRVTQKTQHRNLMARPSGNRYVAQYPPARVIFIHLALLVGGRPRKNRAAMLGLSPFSANDFGRRPAQARGSNEADSGLRHFMCGCSFVILKPKPHTECTKESGRTPTPQPPPPPSARPPFVPRSDSLRRILSTSKYCADIAEQRSPQQMDTTLPYTIAGPPPPRHEGASLGKLILRCVPRVESPYARSAVLACQRPLWRVSSRLSYKDWNRTLRRMALAVEQGIEGRMDSSSPLFHI